MKILHIITSLKIGGAESALFNFLEEAVNSKDTADKYKHFVAYFYPGPNLYKIQKLGIKTFQITGFIYKYDFIAYFRLKNIIKKINPDIIHSALWSANFISKMINTNFFYLSRFVMTKSLNIPIVCDLHSNFLYDGWLRRKIEHFTLLRADKYIAVSKSVKEGFLKSFPDKAKLLNKKTVVIPNAINIDFVTKNNKLITRQNIGIDQNDFVLGAVGRLEKIKCYDLLIKSFATVIKKIDNNLKPLKLVIIGSGSQEDQLKTISKRLKLENKLIFIDQTTDIYSYYSLFDCFIINSKSEGLSIALLEALSFGLPVISTAENLKHDILINEKNGLLILPCNIKMLNNAIEKVYLKKHLLDKMKLENINLIKKHFSISRLLQSYYNIYLEICSK